MAAVIVTMTVLIGGVSQIGLVSRVFVKRKTQGVRIKCPGRGKIQQGQDDEGSDEFPVHRQWLAFSVG